MKFSELSYLTLSSSSRKDSLEFIDPLSKTKREFEIEESVDFLIENFQTSKDGDIEERSKKIAHWWDRNWTVSLDFYLSSINEEKKNFSVSTLRTPKSITYPFHTVDLDTYKKEGGESFSAALLNRKTYRKFLPIQLSLATFSSLLGSVSEVSPSIFTQALDYYIGVFDIEGIPQGIYRYSQEHRRLEGIIEGNFRANFRNILCGMATTLTASFVMIMVADYEFLQNNFFFNKALRDLYIETGRVAQHFLIQGIRNDLGGLPSPAMKDSDMVALLRLNVAHEIPVYSLVIGIPSLASTDK